MSMPSSGGTLRLRNVGKLIRTLTSRYPLL